MQTSFKGEISADCWEFLREASRNVKIQDALLVGSTAELPLEYLLSMLDDFNIDQLKFKWNECAIPHGSLPADGFNGNVFYIEPVAKHSGYVQLRSSSGDFASSTNSRNASANEKPGSKWRAKAKRSFTVVEKYDMNEFLLSQHPLARQLMNYKRFSMNVHMSIKCPHWPREALEWTTRARPYGWPSKTLVESVIAAGCHVVPYVDPNEKQYDNRIFRYCFSVAEVMLIRTWNQVQKYIYHILLLIKTDAVKQLRARGHDGIINTYHFKTLMLWACETRPAEFWEKSRIKSSIGELLCQMIEHLVEKSCPNYFIPSNNLLEHLPENLDLDVVIEPLLVYKEQGASRLAASVPMTDPERMTTLQCSNKVLNIGYLGLGSINLQPWNRISKAPIRRDSLENLPDPSEFADLYSAVMAHLLASKGNTEKVKAQSSSEIHNCDCTKAAIRHFERAMAGTTQGSTQQNVSVCLGDALPDIIFSMMKISNDADTSTSSPLVNSTQNSKESEDAKKLDSHNKPSPCNDDSVTSHQQETSPGVHKELVQINTNSEDPSQLQNKQKEKPPSGFQMMLNLCLNIIMPTMDKELPKATYFLSAAYRANFYYTHLKDCQMALRVCEEALRSIESSNCMVVSYFKDQVCSLVLSQRLMPIFDEHIQTVCGFVTLAQKLSNVTRMSNPVSDTSKTKGPSSSSSSGLLLYLSPSDFMQYIKLQCERKMLFSSSYGHHESMYQMCYRCRTTRRSPEILYAAYRISNSDKSFGTQTPQLPFWYKDNLPKFCN